MDRALYDRCIANGCTPRLAEMLASRSFPGVRGTDRAFLQGLHVQEHDATLESFRLEAEAAGVSTTGKKYIDGLGDYPGDPKAWVSGLDDVRDRLRESGKGCRGAITVEGAPSDPLPERPYGVPCDELVNEEVDRRIEADPSADREALFHEIRDAWSRKDTVPDYEGSGWTGRPERTDAGEEWA